MQVPESLPIKILQLPDCASAPALIPIATLLLDWLRPGVAEPSNANGPIATFSLPPCLHLPAPVPSKTLSSPVKHHSPVFYPKKTLLLAVTAFVPEHLPIKIFSSPSFNASPAL